MHYLGRATPIYMFGDSHCLIYEDMLFKSERLSRTFIFRSNYVPGFQAARFTDSAGNLSSHLVDFLVVESLLDAEGETRRALASGPMRHPGDKLGARAELGRSSPPIFVFCGNVDLRTVFVKQFGPSDNFIFPDGFLHGRDAGPDPDVQGQIIPFAMILDFVSSMLNPLFAGLRLLAVMGFEKVFLVTIPPIEKDDQQWYCNVGYFSSQFIRRKGVLLFNELFRRFAATNQGVHVADIYHSLIRDDALEPDCILDAAHLNKVGALRTADVIEEILARREHLGEGLTPPTSAAEPVVTQW